MQCDKCFLKIPKCLALQKSLDRAPHSERGRGPARWRVDAREGLWEAARPGQRGPRWTWPQGRAQALGRERSGLEPTIAKGGRKPRKHTAQGQRRPAPQQAGGGHTRGGLWGQTGKSHLVRISRVHLEPRTRLKRHIWQPSALGSNVGHHPRGSAGYRGRRLQKSGHWGQAKGKRARAAGYVKKKKFQ